MVRLLGIPASYSKVKGPLDGANFTHCKLAEQVRQMILECMHILRYELGEGFKGKKEHLGCKLLFGVTCTRRHRIPWGPGLASTAIYATRHAPI